MKIILLLQLIWAVFSYFLPLRFTYYLQILVSFVNLTISWFLIGKVIQDKQIFELNNLLFLDALNGVLLLVITGLSFLTSIYSIGYMKKEVEHGLPEKKVREFYFWMNAFIFAMLLVSLSNNFGILWIAIEGTTLATALLISFYRNREAVEAGWKYIILCSVGIALALFGIIILYFSVSGKLGYELDALNWTEIINIASFINPFLLKLAFIFVLVGFGTKMGLAPLHFWLPDAHSQAPTPISALMSGVLLNCAFYSIIRVEAILNKAGVGDFGAQLLVIFGIFTVFVASIFIIKQIDYKRLLAYSTMEHMGIIAFAFGINTKLAIFAGIFHLLNHAFVKGLMFFSVGSVLTNFHTKNFFEIKGLFKTLPITAGLMLLGVLAITGTPPFNIFASEFLVFMSAFKEGYVWQAIILIALLILIFGGFVYHFSQMLMGEPNKEKKSENPWMIIPMLILVIICVVLTFYIPEKINILFKNIDQIVR
ncbi:hydrogenase 4 subunit F [Persephonella sp.]|uniref:hydrogenase 4 subunit F n=1 Tax=Persephonella sp. TaxID=2060922 RepID=UPI00262D8663|nr:hydrogenase 4 subunit F [Persephonella sp.]